MEDRQQQCPCWSAVRPRDAIPSGFPPTDQRGVTRPQGTAADIGAFEADFISAAPAIVAQPQGTTVRAGTNYTLTVGASGTQPLFYQWLKYSNAIAGATSPTLALTNLQAADVESIQLWLPTRLEEPPAGRDVGRGLHAPYSDSGRVSADLSRCDNQFQYPGGRTFAGLPVVA